MAKHKAQPLSHLLAEFLRGTEAETTLLERKVPQLWQELLGPTIAQLTGEIQVKKGVLYVHVYSAALRQQLFEQRFLLIKKLNQALATPLINDIRLLG